MNKKQLQLNMLLLKYKIELMQGNKQHLKDYIATRVILELMPLIVELNYKIEEITLNNLICLLETQQIPEYTIPSMSKLNEIQKKVKKEKLQNIGSDHLLPISERKCELNAAAIWLSLMIKNGMLSKDAVINLTQYKLIDFITDESLIRVLELNKQDCFDLIEGNTVIKTNIQRRTAHILKKKI